MVYSQAAYTLLYLGVQVGLPASCLLPCTQRELSKLSSCSCAVTCKSRSANSGLAEVEPQPAMGAACCAELQVCIFSASLWAYGARAAIMQRHRWMSSQHQQRSLPRLETKRTSGPWLLSGHVYQRVLCLAGCALAATCSGVAVEVEPAPSNGRCLFAGVDITAPPDVVWQALTDYDGLDSFIPGVRQECVLWRLVCKPLRGSSVAAKGCLPAWLEQECVVESVLWL